MLSEEKTKDVLAEFRRLKSPFKVANLLDIDVKEVWAIIDSHPDAAVRHPERHGGEGRPSLRPFFVAKRKTNEAWDNKNDQGCVLARERFCAGTHTMATHRDGSNVFLCSIPLKKRVAPRPDYFKPERPL